VPIVVVRLLLLLFERGVCFCSGGAEEFPDAAGEVAFDARSASLRHLAFGLFAREVGGGVGIPVGLVDGEAAEGAVELAVAAARSRRCRWALPEEAGIGRCRQSLTLDAGNPKT